MACYQAKKLESSLIVIDNIQQTSNYRIYAADWGLTSYFPTYTMISMSGKDRSRKRVRPYPEPHHHFLDLLEKQGPYDNESMLSFKCRLAYVQTARELWLAAYEASQGVMSQACKFLGISDRNSGVMLRNCGLTREILHQAYIGDAPLDVQFAVRD